MLVSFLPQDTASLWLQNLCCLYIELMRQPLFFLIRIESDYVALTINSTISTTLLVHALISVLIVLGASEIISTAELLVLYPS